MTTPAELGFVEPVGTDMVSTGDDDIATNARASAAMFDRLKAERRQSVLVGGTVDMNTFTAADWYRRAAAATSVSNRPQGFNETFEWVTSEIGYNSSTGLIGVCQIARMQVAGDNQGKVAVRYGRKPIGPGTPTWGQWQMEHGFMTLANGDNLDNWKHPTQLEATTQGTARSIVNRPEWFTEQFVIFVHLAGSTIFQTGICWAPNGVMTAVRRSQAGQFSSPWINTSPEQPLNELALSYFGDSQADGTWASAAQAYFPDFTLYDYAYAGDNCQTMMIRNGFYHPQFSVAGGVIPASGSVTLTSSADWELRDSRTFAVGTIAGISGSLTHDTGNQFTFTRGTAGVDTAAPGWQTFKSTMSTASKYIWVEIGGNNFNEDSKRTYNTIAELVLATYREAYDWCIQSGRIPIFAGVSNRLSAVSGSEGFAQVNQINSELRRLYPNAFIDKQAYLVEYAIYDAGFTPTTADLEAMQAGEIPPQLFLDGDPVHLKPEAYAAFGAHRVAPWLAARGYLSTSLALNPLRELHPQY